jgi:hypothetical protein
MVGRQEQFGSISAEKSRARLASPQPRPASPVNGAGGITGCQKDSQPKRSFQPGGAFFSDFFASRQRGHETFVVWAALTGRQQVNGTAQDKKCHG